MQETNTTMENARERGKVHERIVKKAIVFKDVEMDQLAETKEKRNRKQRIVNVEEKKKITVGSEKARENREGKERKKKARKINRMIMRTKKRGHKVEKEKKRKLIE